MGDLLEKIKGILQTDVLIETDSHRIRPESSEVLRLWGDNSLLCELTGFKPDYTIDQGLKLTCEWFLKNENGSKYKAGIYSV
jgi:nucleoside-diphosphate-sugar epimerase